MQSSHFTHHLPLTTSRHAPIGVFDSGVGGLSVIHELMRQMPNERIVYLADTLNVPYGHRPDHEIIQLSAQAVHWLTAMHCKAIVVACNTASAFSLTPLRQYYGDQLPILGLVPAVKPATIATKTKVIGVLATPGTLRGNLLTDVIAGFATPAHIQVITAVSQALVPLIERAEHLSDECISVLKDILEPMIAAGADQLVLGCTHYPFLKPLIEQCFPNQFQLQDSGAGVARHCHDQLMKLDKLSDTQNLGRLDCYVTGHLAHANRVIPLLCQTITQLHPMTITHTSTHPPSH